MSDPKNKFKVPNIPVVPPTPPVKSSIPETVKPFKTEGEHFEYSTKILQLGMAVADAARLIENRCNELSATGWRFKESIPVNSSEAVLIFERLLTK